MIEIIEELINIIGEMALGNNEGRWGDRIWTQEILERLLREKDNLSAIKSLNGNEPK